MERYSTCVLLTALAFIGSISAQSVTPLECTSPPIVANADVSTTGETEGSKATYVCRDGYEASGSMEKICRGGSWTASSPEPSCAQARCPTPPRVSGGSYRSITGRFVLPYYGSVGSGPPFGSSSAGGKSISYAIGSLVAYTCYSGYYISDNSTSTITCQMNKTWSMPLPVCNKKDCGAPSPIEGGNVTYTDTLYFAQASYRCNDGYSLLSNGLATRATTVSIRCGNTGVWARAPECRPKDCSLPSNIANGQRFSEGKHTFGETIYYECNHGYKMRGNASIYCQASGHWSVKPECDMVSCAEPPVVENGTPSSLARASYGKSVRYTCSKGYDLIGPTTVSCQADGSWTQTPVCSVMNCRTPPAIHFGTHTWDLTTYNAYAKYTCDENYRLIGVDKIVCQSDGKWSDAPKCEIPPGSENVPQTAPLTADQGKQTATSSNTSALTGLSIACALFAVITLLSLLVVIYKMFIANKDSKLFSYASYKNGDDAVNSNV